MKFKLSTLVFFIAALAAGFAWYQEKSANRALYAEFKQLKQANEVLSLENQSLKTELKDTETLLSGKGVDDIIDVTTEILKNNFDAASKTLKQELDSMTKELQEAGENLEDDLRRLLPEADLESRPELDDQADGFSEAS